MLAKSTLLCSNTFLSFLTLHYALNHAGIIRSRPKLVTQVYMGLGQNFIKTMLLYILSENQV